MNPRRAVSVRDVCFATRLLEKDRDKPRYELKTRLATAAEKTRFPRHIMPTDDDEELICTRIRAIQGHSTRVDSELLNRKLLCENDSDFPSILGHATNYSSLESILETGLHPGSLDRKRDENHFLPIRPEQDWGSQRWLGSRASMPGMRVGTDIIIYFSTRSMMDAGIQLRQSAGGAVLTKQHVPADTIISVRARENGAVKNVNLRMVEECTNAEITVVIGDDHESAIERGKKGWKNHCVPPPPTWTPEVEEARNVCEPPPSKRSCPEVDKNDLNTLPSWRDEIDWIEGGGIDWGSDDEGNKKASRSKPDAETSRKNSPRDQQQVAETSRKILLEIKNMMLKLLAKTLLVRKTTKNVTPTHRVKLRQTFCSRRRSPKRMRRIGKPMPTIRVGLLTPKIK